MDAGDREIGRSNLFNVHIWKDKENMEKLLKGFEFSFGT